MRKVNIQGKLVGEGEAIFIVAEAGVNHNGDVDLGKELIDVAKEAGADAVKFQTFKAEALVSKYAEKAEYQKETTSPIESQYLLIKKLELGDDELKELYDHAKKRNIIFLSSAFDEKSADLLDSLGVPAFKIPSGEITNIPLLQHIAQKKKPIILSTGMATMDEIEEALNIIKEEGLEDIILLHCITDYPARVSDVNLRVMVTLRKKFDLPVGFSDHTLGIDMPIAAAALGAAFIEKHFTLDRNLPGPDHKSSLEPAELKEMVRAIRNVEEALGDGIKRLTDAEEKNKKILRRSIVAKVNISRGGVLTKEMLDLKRPGFGIAPKYLNKIIGKKAKKDIRVDELITLDKLE
jgi:N-acetylneuraminate synthase/N,N'-diacetyllegionaminate synthase